MRSSFSSSKRNRTSMVHSMQPCSIKRIAVQEKTLKKICRPVLGGLRRALETRTRLVQIRRRQLVEQRSSMRMQLSYKRLLKRTTHNRRWLHNNSSKTSRILDSPYSSLCYSLPWLLPDPARTAWLRAISQTFSAKFTRDKFSKSWCPYSPIKYKHRPMACETIQQPLLQPHLVDK